MSTQSVEDIKRASHGLRGELLASLADPLTGALRAADQTLIKYHGSYQQDDRDLREERRLQKLEPAYAFMIRTRTPGGVVTPAQWLQLDAIATRYAERGLRITTRQAFQFHGVIKGELKATMQAINAALIDTLAACGDVNRNVAVAANPHLSAAHAQVFAQAAALSEHLLPNTRAYYEIWLDGGAHLYVCGDATRMARDVHAALLDIVATHGGRDADAAADYLQDLQQQGRYARDVY
jgi:sulfite reductase (NADPH) hemoprotein beta-component